MTNETNRNEILLSLQGLGNRKEFHRALAGAMDFPDYYGKNLDAMMDCLTDLGTATHLILTDTQAFAEALPTYFASIQRVMDEAAEANSLFSWEIREEITM